MIPEGLGELLDLLLAETEGLHDRPVAGYVSLSEIILEPPSPADHSEETHPRMDVLLVDFKVVGDLDDPGSEQSDLHFGRTGIGFLQSVLLEHFFFLFFWQRHSVEDSFC